MKRVLAVMLTLMLTLSLTLTLVGCGGAAESPSDDTPAAQIADDTPAMQITDVTPTSQITELASGLYAVAFKGDDGFDEFLARGGASNEEEIVQYLTAEMGVKNAPLQFTQSAFGCSTIMATNSAGEILFGRNFDWRECNAVIVLSEPTNGYASISTSDIDFIIKDVGLMPDLKFDEQMTLPALYTPLDGMNEAGLVVSILRIKDNVRLYQDTDNPDLTTTTAIRMLLNKAGSVDEAVELLSQYDLHATEGFMFHFALADLSGKSVVVEYIDNEMQVIETPVVTNFYLTPGEKYGVGTAQAMTRYETLIAALAARPTLEADDVRDALDSVSKHNYDDNNTTEWSAVFNLNTGEVQYYHREDFTRRYDFLLPIEELPGQIAA